MERGPVGQETGTPYEQAPPPAYHQLETSVAYTANCVQPVKIMRARSRPDNHLGMAIFVTLFCCIPFGCIGILHSLESTAKFDSGDDTGAINSADIARKWSTAGLVCGVVILVIFIMLRVSVDTYNST